ncbi:MAG: exo-alpha-sialidase [Planctomycetaceae bacterium]|nr:exo-alpha-sialidase [Planctomycetaceae bacterium]
MRLRLGCWLLFVLFVVTGSYLQASDTEPQVALTLPPGPENPRNSEGDFITLKDGRIKFIYTHFTNGAGDHANAHLASRQSSDGGLTWTNKDRVEVPNEGGFNIMSVSLLRLEDSRIALFYLRKNSLDDCRPVFRLSADETKTWSEPHEIISEADIGYYVLNNDRAVQLKNGRLILPLAQHVAPDWEKWTAAAKAVCYYSDDAGTSWTRSQQVPPAKEKSVIIQEPGVVELKDGRLMMFSRTNAGSQFVSYSSNEGKSWTAWEASDIISPRSPATIERIPSTGDLLLVWNDHRHIDPALQGKRTPFTAAISMDEGKTWKYSQNLEENPHGWYCYTAMTFHEGHVLLGHCAGDRRENNGLAESQVMRIPVSWFYPAER